MSNNLKSIKQIAVGGLCCLLFMGEPAYAGSLNANEQELMSIIRGTYTYNGVTYKVKDKYIQMAADYLAQDSIDTTDEQKQKAINKMYSSVQQGIDEGYLEPVGNESSVKGTAIDKTHVSGNSQIKERSATEEALNDDKAVSNSMLDTTEAPVKASQILALESYANVENESDNSQKRADGKLLPIPNFPWNLMKLFGIVVCAGVLICTVAAVRSELLQHKKRKRGIL